MIKSNLPANLFKTLRPMASTSKPAPTAEAKAALPADSANISFSSPLSNNATALLSATADEAAKLEGNLGDHEPGEIILRTKGGFSLMSGSVIEDFGATVLDEFDTPGGIHKSEAGEFVHIKLPAGVSTAEAMAAMAKDERVEFAVPNNTYGLPEEMPAEDLAVAPHGSASAPNDPSFGKLFGLHNEGQTGGTVDADIDAPEAWAIETGRDQDHYGPTVAVIDTGIDYNHPDLKDNMWTNPGEIAGDGIDNDNNGVIDDVHGYNAFADNGDPMDGHSHGTHCAGTIAAQGNNNEGVVGVSQNSSLMGIKIFSDAGRTSAAAIIRGIQYGSKMGARIANNSWGGGRPNEGIKAAFAESPTMHLVASGNDGKDNDVRASYPANYDLPNIISVAATDHKDNLAYFSNYGATTVDIAAPGVAIHSTIPNGRYGNKSGTSMATPHMTGATALVATHFPGISNADLRERMLGSSETKPQLTGKLVTDGRLNVADALTWESGQA